MKAICDGTRTKSDVVYANIEQYREVYVRAVQQLDVLKAVRSLSRQLDEPISTVKMSVISSC